MLKTCFTAALLLSVSGFARGVENNWSNMGITGGKVLALAHHPSAANVLLAAGAQSVYKTTDGGHNWAPVLRSIHPLSVAFAKSRPGRAYAAGAYDGAFYRSDDSGDTWTFVSSMSSSGFAGGMFDAGMAVDPEDENIIYGADSDENPRSVYKSADGGATWTLVKAIDDGSPLPSYDGSAITALIVPAHDTVLFTTNKDYGDDGAIYRSINAGVTWASFTDVLNTDPTLRPLNCIAADRADPGVLYAGGESIFKSADYGATWISTPSLSNEIYSITVKGPDNIVGCEGANCHESTDGGATWVSTAAIDDTLSGNIQGPLLYSPADGALYLADSWTGAGIYKSSGTNLAALTFAGINKGLHNVSLDILLHDAANADVIYAANQVDLYVSTNSGKSWLRRFPADGGKRSGAFALLTDTDGTLYAGIGQYLRKSTDFGGTWSPVYDFSSLNLGNIMALAFDPADHNTLYLGAGGTDLPAAGAGLYKSTNKGSSWGGPATIYFHGLTVSQISVSSTDPNIIYAVSNPIDKNNSYLYKTTDGGTTWTQLSRPEEGQGGYINTLMPDPDQDGTVYVANDWNIYRSRDSGATWASIYNDAQGGVKKFYIHHPAGGARALYSGLDDSVYMDINEGASWTRIGSGFNGVKALAPGSLYVGTGEGLYKTAITSSQVAVAGTTVLASAMASGGTVSISIPQGAFGAGTSVVALPFDPGAVAADANMLPGALGVNIQTNSATQPAAPVTLAFTYANSDIAGLDPASLAIVRLDDTGSGYTVLDSRTSGGTVTAATSHFSRFVLAQYTPSAAITPAPIAYPMPYNPVTRPAGMSIINLAAGSQVKIYTIMGQLVRKIEVPPSGTALWNGRNDAGKMAASGIYIALVRDQAQKIKRLKLAVEK